ncbi:MAG: hypothetical protein ACRELE_01975, partial [Gemmatimonadales bacterium]
MCYGTTLFARIATATVLFGCVVLPGAASQALPASPSHLVVTLLGGRPLALIHPEHAWGAALDGHDSSEAATIYTPHN